MLDAKAMLGSAGRQVQLLGIDANPKATSIEDVLSYSEVHGMVHAWDFLTGSLTTLKRVWKEYSIGAEITRNLVALYREKNIRTVIGQVVDFSQVPQAFEDMAASRTTGRIIVRL